MVFITNFAALLLAAKLASGLKVTSPTETDTWKTTDSLTVQWSSVATDPSTFNIEIDNKNGNTYPTGFSKVIKQDVSATDGTYTVTAVEGLKVGPGFQISLVSDTGAILAQSAPFNITATGSSSSTNSTVAPATNSSAASPTNTSVGSVTPTPASNASANGTVSGNTTSPSNSTPSSKGTSGASSSNHLQGLTQLMFGPVVPLVIALLA